MSHSAKRYFVHGLKNKMSMAKDSYFDRRLQSQVLRVQPCEYAVSCDPLVIVTGLGSCVAVCLIDSGAGVCGMNHFMLPEVLLTSHLHSSQSARYGANAMELLINRCMQMGARRTALVAKVFGGASILNTQSDIGANNSQFALDYLRREAIPVVSSDLGGTRARKVFLKVPTGEVSVEIMNSLPTVLSIEDHRRRDLGSAQIKHSEDSVELFAGDWE